MLKAIRVAMFSVSAAAVVFGSRQAFGSVYTVNTLDGSQPGFSYDHDAPAPTITNGGFFAQGSFGSPGDYNTVQISPAAIGLAGITLGQIQSIAYDTTEISGNIDWQAKTYTVTQPGQTTGFYGARLLYGLNAGTPHSTATTLVDGSTYNNWITDGTTNPTTLYIRQNNPTGYDAFAAAAANEPIAFFSFDAGARTGGGDYNTFLNNIVITPTATSGYSTAVVNAAVPEPLSAGILAIGALGMLGRRRNRA